MAQGKNLRKKARRRQETLDLLQCTNTREYESLLRLWFCSWLSSMLKLLTESIRVGKPQCPDHRRRDQVAAIDDLVKNAFEIYSFVAQQIGPSRLPRFKDFSQAQLKTTIVAIVQAECQHDDLGPAREFLRGIKIWGDDQLWKAVREELREWFTENASSEISRRANSLWARTSGLADLIDLVDRPTAEAVRDQTISEIQKATRMSRISLCATVK